MTTPRAAMKDVIERVEAREILSGSGRPTVEARITTTSGVVVEASVPSGTSRGKYEAFELYDREKRFHGLGVRRAVENVNLIIAPAIKYRDVTDQSEIDQTLIDLDGTVNKSRLGGNAILAVSVACAKAGAESCGLPCFRYLGGLGATRLPVPLATVIAGGEHSPSDLDFEDYLYVMQGFTSFSTALEALVETRYALGCLLEGRYGPAPEVGGALAPPIDDTRQAFDLMLEASERAGFSGRIGLGLDAAASELYLEDQDAYRVAGSRMRADELIQHYVGIASEYPLVFIEDPFQQDDFFHSAQLTSLLPDKRIVGDDLLASNPGRIKKGIEERAVNALLLKINQIGTVSEACRAADLAMCNQMAVTVSLRSNDTNDSFIADFAVAMGAEQIKLGSPVRGERNAKYNRLLAIEGQVGNGAWFSGGINP